MPIIGGPLGCERRLQAKDQMVPGKDKNYKVRQTSSPVQGRGEMEAQC